MASKNTTQVLIDGKIYTMSGYESEEYLQRVAAWLNNKLAEIKGAEGYARMSLEMRCLLLNLNTADDYFKLKEKTDRLTESMSGKDKELYEIKHELISAQMQLESLTRELETEKEAGLEAQRELTQLRTRLEDVRSGLAGTAAAEETAMKEAATREDALKMVAPEETAFYGSGLRESSEKDAKNKGAKIDEETKTEVEANTEDIAIEEAQVDRAEGKEATSRKEASGKEDSRSNREPAGKEEISPKPAVLAALETLKETEETKKSEEPDTPEETDTSEEPGASEETDMPEEPKGSEEEATPSTNVHVNRKQKHNKYYRR